MEILKEEGVYEQFRKPAINMIAKLPESIQEECRDFVLNYKEEDLDLLKKYNHDKTWKEDEEELKKITTDILNVV